MDGIAEIRLYAEPGQMGMVPAVELVEEDGTVRHQFLLGGNVGINRAGDRK